MSKDESVNLKIDKKSVKWILALLATGGGGYVSVDTFFIPYQKIQAVKESADSLRSVRTLEEMSKTANILRGIDHHLLVLQYQNEGHSLDKSIELANEDIH